MAVVDHQTQRGQPAPRERLARVLPEPRAHEDSGFVRATAERTRKTWIFDWLAAVSSIVVAASVHIDFERDALTFIDSTPMIVAHVLVMPVVATVLFWRRRWPLQVAVVIAALSVVAPGAGLAALIAAYTVGAYGRRREAKIAIPLLIAGLLAGEVIWPQAGGGGTDLITPPIFVLGVAAWGLFVGARRELVATLTDRAARAETEQALRVEQARGQERTRIAREMHDVLAHRMSLLSVHAGALEFRPDAPPQEIARAAGVIRATAHEALEELRAVIGVMRVGDALAPADGTGAESPEPPQPTLTAVPHLVEQWREAGARIALQLDQEAMAAVPTPIGRAAYRIVQEALTNAGKHAPAALVEVGVSGTPGGSLVVSVTNPLPVSEGVAAGPSIPGTGLGLIGLRERVELLGGAFAAGVDEDLGRFVVEARLPWSAA